MGIYAIGIDEMEVDGVGRRLNENKPLRERSINVSSNVIGEW